MTRVRTHHEFVQRPVWDKLGADAFLLHHAALAYVNAHGTDGLVPRSKVKALHSAVKAPTKQVQGLLAEQVWAEHDPESYRVCDVQDDLRQGGGRGDEQPSAEYVRREQQRAKERKDAWRQKKEPGRNAGRNGVPTSVRNKARDSAVQDRAVQDPYGSGPALVPSLVEEDCEHGVDRFASCADCARERKAAVNQ